MNYLDDIVSLAQSHNGTVTATMVSDAGIPRYCLKQLCDRNDLIRVARGVYVLPDVWEDDLYILQYTYRKGIFSHGTALWLLDYSDRTPSIFTMTFPYGYHVKNLATKIHTVQTLKGLYELGLDEARSPGGHSVRVYSIERTLCDIVRGKNIQDIQLVQQAMRKYLSSKERNIPFLLIHGLQLLQ